MLLESAGLPGTVFCVVPSYILPGRDRELDMLVIYFTANKMNVSCPDSGGIS